MITPAPLPIWALFKWPEADYTADLVLAWEDGEPLVWDGESELEWARQRKTFWTLIPDLCIDSAPEKMRNAIIEAKGWAEA